MAMRIYRAPNGMTYQYEEGKAPPGYVEVRPPAARSKARTAQNKARATQNKTRG